MRQAMSTPTTSGCRRPARLDDDARSRQSKLGPFIQECGSDDYGRCDAMSRTSRDLALQDAEKLVAGLDTPARAVKALAGYWHHTFELADGTVINGGKTPAALEVEYKAVFDPLDLAGRSVLDIGAWNGAFSFEAERRGAARVLAVDDHVWLHTELRGLEKFLYIRKDKASRAEYQVRNIEETNVDILGLFDAVLFLGVFYHLQDPIAALNAVARMTRDCLVLETHLDVEDVPYPAMRYYPGAELGGDGSNWWGPNPACVEALLRTAGFARVEFLRNPTSPTRGIFHARR